MGSIVGSWASSFEKAFILFFVFYEVVNVFNLVIKYSYLWFKFKFKFLLENQVNMRNKNIFKTFILINLN